MKGIFNRRPNALSLEGLWDFKFFENINIDNLSPASIDYDDKMWVPGCFDSQGKYAGKHGAGFFKTTVPNVPGKGLLLEIGAISLYAKIYVDQKLVATALLPYSPVKCFLSPCASQTREIVIAVSNISEPQTTPLYEPYFDFYGFGGILRTIKITPLEDLHIKRLFLDASDLKTGRVKGRLTASRKPESTDKLTVTVDGMETTPSNIYCNNNEEILFDFKVESKLESPKLWSPENPVLYSIAVKLGNDVLRERIGFRKIEIDGCKILLNGKQIKLIGWNRHESSPKTGSTLSLQETYHDLCLLRELGANFIRGCHYKQDERFLDLCDEEGFLVFEESLAWQNKYKQHFSKPLYVSKMMEQTELMVTESIHHPSVIMWGYLNESESDNPDSVFLYKQLYEKAKALDPTRPVTYASNRFENDVCYDYCDIVSTNMYPGWYYGDELHPLHEIEKSITRFSTWLDKTPNGKKPLLISEIGAGALYGWHDPFRGHWTEEYQSDLLETVFNIVINSDRLIGVAYWQFCDGRTYANCRAAGRPRGFNNKGIVDEYRRPKAAFYKMQELIKKSR